MKLRLLAALLLSFVFAATVLAQDAAPGGGYGQRGGRGGMGGGMGAGMMALGSGRGLMGTVSAVAADHFNIKTYLGENYVVHYSVNTRFAKQPAGMGQGMGRGQGMRRRQDQGEQPGGPQGARGQGGNLAEIKSTDIKAGDDIAVMGEIDPVQKSAGAVTIVLVDPERAQMTRQMMAGFGKTWIMGKVTAIDGVKVTVDSSIDNAVHVLVADENTTFRKRRDPITLTDVQVGDTLRAEGSVKGGVIAATTVNVMAMPQGGAPMVPRNGPPQPPQPQQ
jgi:hypothetical protein